MAKTLQESLLPLRQRIDAVDEQLLSLLNERAQLAVSVGEVKQAFGETETILKPEREAQIIRRLQEANKSKLFPSDAVGAVWTEIISACRVTNL